MGLAIPPFEEYLKVHKKRNISQIICYVRKYGSILESGDVSPLTSLTGPQRRHAMEALTVVSKLTGKYQLWKEIRSKYQLGWGSACEDNLRYFTSYLNGHSNLDVMLDWLKDALRKLPRQVGNVLLHNTLTGLRPSENILCIKLIQTDFDNYANEELGVLENFRYPEFFEKKTKKSYLTIYDDLTLE